MSRRAFNGRTAVLVLSLVVSLGLSALAYQAATVSRLPSWVEMQEGPVTHGVEKFYRNAYFKGNIQSAGNATVGGSLDVTGLVTMTSKSTADILSMGGVTSGTITSTRTITPSYTLYRLDPVSEITITLSPCTDNGQLLMLYDAQTSTVNIADSDILPTGAFTLGQYDLYIGLCNGADWLTLQTQDN